MTVSKEIKSQLAKLLATEDLVVEHRRVATAQFDVHTRVLTLPMWEKASNVVYDMLVGHEVGHALYTPDENWLEKKRIPHQFVNVVEDARIEKLMKRRYAGLSKTFYNGYKELNEQDFFAIADSNIADLNLADRSNLYFKIGNFLNLTFTEEEKVIVQKIAEVETFDEVLDVAEELYLFCKKKVEEQEEVEVPPSEQNSPEAEEESERYMPQGENEDTDVEESEQQTQQIEEPQVETADSLADNLEELIDKHGSENIYCELPKLDLKKVIVDNSKLHQYIDAFDARQLEKGASFDFPDASFREFKKSAQKEVNYLVKEFECKKAADSYARAQTSRTGVLDCTKLHTYKYNEDLFRKVTTYADGKNHGLIFVLDWSGSMQYVLEDTCKQLFNLIWFCKKVNIPFDVYAFTNEYRKVASDWHPDELYKKKVGLFAVENDFSMMNLLTSKTSSAVLEKQMLTIWRMALAFGNAYRTQYTWSPQMCLSGTPLNESLVALHGIIPKFQRENKLQKVQCIILTDGEANQLNHHVEIKRHWECDPRIVSRRFGGDMFLRDRKTGHTYNMGYYWHHFTDKMLQNLRDNFPYVNFIGIRLLAPRDAKSFMNRYGEDDTVAKSWKKDKSFVIKTSGYDAYFGMSANALSQDSEFEVEEGATKAKIKSAFVKSLKTKKLNKKVLGEFISLVV
jgi:hypothetical protein|tara:strand:+ start:684 stop:2726 length:2043 start_codon:yes stop_codon:yes gene_type:complete